MHRAPAVEGGPQEALLFGYDANGRLSTLSTRINGVVNEQVSYGYDAAGRLSSVLVDLTPADAAGDRDSWDAGTASNNDGYRFQTVYTYVDASSLRLSQVRQSDGTIVSYTYDAQGRVKTLTRGDTNTNDADGQGQTLTFTYDDANRSTEVADSTGRSYIYVYDAAGQITGYTGKTEIGQNIRTSLAQAIADELRVPMPAVALIMADTDLVPFDPGTFGSLSTPRMAGR